MYKSYIGVVVLLAQAAKTLAGTVTYTWETTWVTAAPDGFSRPVIGINGAWPCPKIEATAGDTVVVKLTNGLTNETTGLHFHGISQVGTNFMDGASMVNQCPVAPGSSITYTFKVSDPGTYWYHSHNMGQYPDGLRGPMIVHDPLDPYANQYDEEVILTVSDWYHEQTTSIVPQILTPSNTNFIPVFPDGIIVNEGGNGSITVQPGKTYRIRMISFSALGSAMVNFNSHNMTVIMTDSSYVKKQQTSQLRLAPAQRYDVLISISSGDTKSYPYLFSLDINRDFTADAASNQWPHNFTGHLVQSSDPNPSSEDVVNVWEPFNEGKFVPYDNQATCAPATKSWRLDFQFCFDANNYPRACFNNQTYIGQKVPTLYSAASLGSDNTNPVVYGDINPFVVRYGDVVEIVVNNLDAATHPFHLHGHQFQIVELPPSGSGTATGAGSGASSMPPRRDTVAVQAGSYAVLRFIANNPGVFLFHCHIEWHVEMGLTATLLEAPEMLRGINIPQDHLDNCKAMGIPTAGNAAGNTASPTNTTGFNTVPPTSYTGALYSATATSS